MLQKDPHEWILRSEFTMQIENKISLMFDSSGQISVECATFGFNSSRYLLQTYTAL